MRAFCRPSTREVFGNCSFSPSGHLPTHPLEPLMGQTPESRGQRGGALDYKIGRDPVTPSPA